MYRTDISPKARLALGLALSLAAFLPAACAPQATSPVIAQAPGAAPTSDVATILASDPKYSDFLTIIGAVGLGPALNNAKNVTIFAPTNAAFDRTYPGWVNLANTNMTAQNGDLAFARERLVESGAVQGVYPPEAFAGKRQRVMTMGGTVFEADGTVPGRITLSLEKPPAPTGMGYPATAAAHIAELSAPIRGTNGIVYSADAVIVH